MAISLINITYCIPLIITILYTRVLFVYNYSQFIARFDLHTVVSEPDGVIANTVGNIAQTPFVNGVLTFNVTRDYPNLLQRDVTVYVETITITIYIIHTIYAHLLTILSDWMRAQHTPTSTSILELITRPPIDGLIVLLLSQKQEVYLWRLTWHKKIVCLP